MKSIERKMIFRYIMIPVAPAAPETAIVRRDETRFLNRQTKSINH